MSWQMARPDGPPYIKIHTLEEVMGHYDRAVKHLSDAELALGIAEVFEGTSPRWGRAAAHARGALAEAQERLAFHASQKAKAEAEDSLD